MSFWGILLRFD